MSGAAAWVQGPGPEPGGRRFAWGTALAVTLALVAHVALFGLLSVLWRGTPPPPVETKPVEVSLVDAVALDQHAPKSVEAPSQSTAPEPAPPEDAPPPAPVEKAAPEPAPPQPQPRPAPPPPKPAPKAAPLPPKPVAVKPDKPAPAKAKPAAAPAKTVATSKATGTSKTATKARPTGSLLDDDFRQGLTQAPSRAKASAAAPGATMDAAAAADIGSAIQRQVQPCAARQSVSGPGVSRIIVKVRLQLNRDGSLAANPAISDDHGGVDDENSRYVDAVDRAAIAAFRQCAPLKGLPLDLYDVPRGWKTFTLRFKLPS